MVNSKESQDPLEIESAVDDAHVEADGSPVPKEPELDELQCEEVDMNHRLMDPFEWAARKIIPIPKKYYWETGNYDVSFRTKVWHRAVQSMGLTLRGVEKVGDVIVRTLGLNNSRFDDVTSFMTDEEWKEARENAKRDKEKRKAHLKKKKTVEIHVV